MTQWTLAQANGYSWAAHEWLNTNASYHRMVYEDRNNVHNSEETKATILRFLNEFRSWDRSRLVLRTLLSWETDALQDVDQYINLLGGTMWYYINHQPNTRKFYYLTISFNRDDRNLSTKEIKQLSIHNKKYIEKILSNVWNFEEFSLGRLRDFHAQWYSITDNVKSHELEALWWDSFGWSENACEALIQSTDGSYALWVRSKNKVLIAAVLYSHQSHSVRWSDWIIEDISHGETTEASTTPVLQWKGIMPMLVTGLHANLISKGIYNVYGELRATDFDGKKPNSLSHGIKSWKEFHFPENSSNLLLNHVSIGWLWETYNLDRKISGYMDSPFEELRTFMIGAMNPEKFTPKIIQSYNQSIS